MKEKTENFTLKLNPIKSDPSKNRIYQKKKVEQKIIKDSIGIYPFKALNFIRREIRNTTAPNKNLPIKKNDNCERKEKSKSIDRLGGVGAVGLDKKEEEKKEVINYNFNDYELNNLSYSDAIKYDHRTCFQYYICLIKMKQPIIFGFCPFKDYNTIIIKSCIFSYLSRFIMQ